jgi:micrococcal nuclease
MKGVVRWWKRRTRLQKMLLVLAVIVLGIVGAVAPDKPDSPALVTNSTLAFGAVSPTSSSPVGVAPTASTTTMAPPTTTASLPTTTALATHEPEIRVASVVDGDTIVVVFPGALREEVRLIGIDTPETGEDFSREATEALNRLVGGATVRLETDVEIRDQYDRLLAYVWVGATLANAELLRQGLATIYTVPPNVKYSEALQAAQDEAQTAQSGVWGEPADSPLRIVAVEYNAPGDDSLSLNEEYVTFEILVSGTLLGYSVEDQTGNRYRFPDRVYEKGNLITLRSGQGAETQTDLYWGAQGAAIWNNDGDTVKVLDPHDQIVASYDY